MRNRTFATAIALPCTLALVACGTTAGDDDGDAPARVRVVHASPDAGGVDVHAEGTTTPLISNLRYGEVTPYLELEPGTYNLQVRPTGRLDAPLYETGDITLEIGAEITAVATGFAESTDADDRFRILALKDAFTDAGAGARVRIVHASADAPTVGIDVGNDDPLSPEIAELRRFADTGPEGALLPAGAELQVGITADHAPVTAFTTPALPAGAQLYVIAAGRLGESPRAETGFSLMAVGPDGLVGAIPQNPMIYALHASPDAPAVDLRAGGALLAGNLAYGQIGKVQVPPGSAVVDILPAGGTTVVYSAQLADLAAGESYLALAAGFLAPQPEEAAFRVIAVQDELADDDVDNARTQIIHASPDAPAVDISTVSNGLHLDLPLLVEGLRFGDVTEGEGLSVPAATFDLGIAQAGVPSFAARFGVTTARGQRAIAIAAGAFSPSGEQKGFSLMVVDTSAQPWTVASIYPH
jgi:hypothetical protein